MTRRRKRPNFFALIVLALVLLFGYYFNQVYLPAQPNPFEATPTPTRSPEGLAMEAEELFKAMDVTAEVPVSYAPTLASPLSHLSHLEALAPQSPTNGSSRSKDLMAALKEAGIDHVTLSDVQELQSNRITAEYVREILALGLRPDGLSEWIDLRNHGVTPRYVRELREMGVTGFEVDEITELKDNGVSGR